DTHWCSYCDKAVSPFSDSLYCSDECLRQDALQHHPVFGYDFSEYRGFLSTNATERRTSWGTVNQQESSNNSTTTAPSSSLPHLHHHS
ncbi:hypothetical protein BDB00DRAFT_746360, partial [Zychaea mexicana]|uniref:uncharacterized protein n=1 Tax=Zychaea mexicana TaxID=64656 RepID=UPI0022FDDC47